MGFCLFNSIAVAAAHARAAGLARVAIVDFDVHHGNGTQAAFYDDPAVLFVSSHQYPVLPGDRRGHRDRARRRAPASPSTCRSRPGPATPISTRSTGGWRVPVLDAFAPELVLVSAGFDAHEDDPLAALRMTAGRVCQSHPAAAAAWPRAMPAAASCS